MQGLYIPLDTAPTNHRGFCFQNVNRGTFLPNFQNVLKIYFSIFSKSSVIFGRKIMVTNSLQESRHELQADLTDLQLALCHEMMEGGTMDAAARRAGIEGKNARIVAAKMLNLPHVSAYLQTLRDEVYEANRLNMKDLANRLADMVQFDVAECYNEDGSLMNVKKMPLIARLLIDGVETEEIFDKEGLLIGYTKKIKFPKRLEAVEKLIKILGGYEADNRQKPNVSQTFNIQIVQPGEVSMIKKTNEDSAVIS